MEFLQRLAVGGVGLLMIGLRALSPQAETRTIVGKPLEVRSYSRMVVMPGEGTFTYICWKDTGRGSGTCPAEVTWARLPRWPDPSKVQMEVSGREIRSLVMDGVIVVDRAEFQTGHAINSVLCLLIGLGLTGWAAHALLRCARADKSPRVTKRPFTGWSSR